MKVLIAGTERDANVAPVRSSRSIWAILNDAVYYPIEVVQIFLHDGVARRQHDLSSDTAVIDLTNISSPKEVASMQTESAACKLVGSRALLASMALSVAVLPCLVYAQDKEPATKSYRDRVCDFVILADGIRLTGIAVNESPARLILRSERLKADAPDLFTSEIQPAVANQIGEQNRKLISMLQLRADQLKIDVPDDVQQIGLLEEVIERLKLDDNQVPPWIIAEIEPKRLKRLETLPPSRRELAKLALLNQIEDFEDLHWKTLTIRLQAIPAPQLKLPSSPQQLMPPEVTAERVLAAIDVRLNKATRLIRTGDEFLPEDTRPDFAALLSTLAGNSWNNTLQGLLNETVGAAVNPSTARDRNNASLPQAAIRFVEHDGYSTAVVSSFEFDIAHGAASVTRQLFRDLKHGGWNLVSSATGSSTTNDLTQEEVRKLEDDPQVEQISGFLSQLNPDRSALKTALLMGAVVQSASSKADVAFQRTLQDILTARMAVTETPPTVVLHVTPVKSCPACDDDE